MNRKYLILGISIFCICIVVLVLFNLKEPDNPVDDPIVADQLDIYFTDTLIKLKPNEKYHSQIEIENPKNEDFDIEYGSSDEEIAVVDSNGVITALNYGIATITASIDKEVMTSIEVNVLKEEIAIVKPEIPIERLDIIKDEITLTSNQKYQLETTIYPNNSTSKVLMYETNDSRIAEVTDSGLVIGKVAGSTTINVYSNNGKTDVVNVTVNAPTVILDDIQIMPNTIVLTPNETYQFRTVLIPSNAVSDIDWESSNNDIVTVNNRGLVTAKKVGTATITASCDGILAEATVTVKNQGISTIVTTVSLNKKSVELDIGQTEKIIATVLPNNATNKGLIWSSSNSSVATVSSSGLIKAKSKGKSIITVKSVNNVSATVTVTVTEKVSSDIHPTSVVLPTEILMNFENLSLEKRATKQLRATLLPLNATDKSVTWTSSDQNVVSVSSTGLITAKKIGEAMISAISSNGKVAKAKVTVTAKPVTPSTQASYYGNGNLSESAVATINEHLNDYLEEAAYRARKSKTISERKAKVAAAAYFLIFNPYYKVPYGYGGLSKYNYQGWNPSWSNRVGVECSGFVTWSLIQAGLPLGTKAQYYPARITQSDANDYWTVDYVLSIPGLQIGDILNKRYPRDENNKKLGNGHWAVIVDINRKNCTLTVAHATSVKEGLHLSTYKCGTTIHYNRAFNTDLY